MNTTIDMKEDLCSFCMEKDEQNYLIFEKMPPLRGLMKDVWLGNTFYIR